MIERRIGAKCDLCGKATSTRYVGSKVFRATIRAAGWLSWDIEAGATVEICPECRAKQPAKVRSYVKRLAGVS